MIPLIHFSNNVYIHLLYIPLYMPRVDEDIERKVVLLYKNGWSKNKISKELGIHYATVQRILWDAGLLDKKPAIVERIEKKSRRRREKKRDIVDEEVEDMDDMDVNADIQDLEEEDIVEKERKSVKKIKNAVMSEVEEAGSDIENAYNILSQYGMGDDVIWKLRAKKREYERLRKELMKEFGIGEETGLLNVDRVNTLRDRIKRMEEDAKAVLESLGYKVVRKDQPTSIQEAIKMLKASGYEVKSTTYTKEQVDKIIEEEKKKLEEYYRKEMDKKVQEQRVNAVQNIVTHVIDRLFDLFTPIRGAVTESAYKEVEEKRKKKQERMNRLKELVKDIKKEGGEESNG